MKDKAMKVFGLFMTIALLAGLAGASVISTGGVSSAATSSLEWTPFSVPDETHSQLYPGSDVGPMALTSDGGTLFASVNASGDWDLLKSTDGGYTWRETGFPTGSTEIVAVKLSPSWSSDGTIYVATTDSVYRSKDRGGAFTALSMSGVGGTITSLDTGKNAEGKVMVVLGTSTEVYLFEDGWVAQGIGSYSVLAVAFSPSYATDEVIVAVVNSETQTLVRTKAGAWGSIANALITNNTSYRACIGLPSDYSTTAPKLFVGLSGASNIGDIFSIAWSGGFTSTDLDVSANGDTSSVNIWSMALSGSFSQAVIVAGAETATSTSNGSILVFASSDGGASWAPKTTANKQPTGETRATVVKTDSVAYVGTCGNQSAVSVDLTGEYTSWNQRGLIDTSLDIVTDMFVSSEYFSDSTMYITTSDSEASSLWITQTGGAQWERIFCSSLTGSPADCVFDMLRVGADALVLVQRGTTAIWLSTNSGESFSNEIGPQVIGGVSLGEAITAFTLGSNSSTFYVGGAHGSVNRSVDYGRTWPSYTGSGSEIPDSDTVTDIILSDNSSLYVSTDGGGVYYASVNDYTFLPVGADTPGVSGDIVRLAPDTQEAYLYAGIAGSGGTKGIWRYYLGEDDADWEQIADSAAVGNISSLACAEDNGILYAISSTDGIGYRCVRPTSVKEDPEFEPFNAGLGTDEKVKSGLKVISGSNLLFAIGGAGDAYNRIWTASDEIIKMKLLAPANGAMTGDIWQNGSYIGKARVALWWKTVADAGSYEVQIASDANFVNVLYNSCFESGSQYTASNVTHANLWLGSKYYWRIRVVDPYRSQWSDNWSFITPLGPKTSLPELLSPVPGKTGVSLQPILGWNNSVSATNYELILAECDTNTVVLNLTGDKKLGAVTAYPVTSGLKPGTSYCWKVRGLSDLTTSEWSDTGTFTTAAVAAPIEEEDTGTPAWVWIIIAISTVLIVAVIVLVIRTRSPI